MDVSTFDEMYGLIKDLRKELGFAVSERDYYRDLYEKLEAEYHFLQEERDELLDWYYYRGRE